MRRLHIRIDLPPNTAEALRQAYAPANDPTWMIPFEDETTVEQLAHSLQKSYQSRYPEFAKEVPLLIRKIYDGYGMVPDRGSPVGSIWEERKIGISMEEYTVRAMREELNAEEVAFLLGRTNRGRQFTLAPESSARIQKRPYAGDGGRQGAMAPPLLTSVHHASKRRRVDQLHANVVDLSQQSPLQGASAQAESATSISADLSRQLTPVAVEDSQSSPPFLWDHSTGDRGKSPKSESPEPSTEHFQSVPASQLDTPDTTSDESHSLAVRDANNTHGVQEQETCELPQTIQDNAPCAGTNNAESFGHSEPRSPSGDVFDVPLGSPEAQPVLKDKSPGRHRGVKTASAADMLTQNRRRNNCSTGPQSTPRRSLLRTAVTPNQESSGSRHSSAFRTRSLPQANSESEEDDSHVSSRLSSSNRRASKSQSKDPVEENTSSYDDAVEAIASPTDQVEPDRNDKSSRPEAEISAVPANETHANQEKHDSSQHAHSDQDRSQTKGLTKHLFSRVAGRAAAKKSRMTTNELYEEANQERSQWENQMLDLPSPVVPQSLTPMIPGARPNSVLKRKAPSVSDTGSSSNFAPSDGVQSPLNKKRSVSFIAQSGSEQEASNPPVQRIDNAKTKATPRTPAKGPKAKKQKSQNQSDTATVTVTPTPQQRAATPKAKSKSEESKAFRVELLKILPKKLPPNPGKVSSAREKSTTKEQSATPIRKASVVAGEEPSVRSPSRSKTTNVHKNSSESLDVPIGRDAYRDSPIPGQEIQIRGDDIRVSVTQFPNPGLQGEDSDEAQHDEDNEHEGKSISGGENGTWKKDQPVMNTRPSPVARPTPMYKLAKVAAQEPPQTKVSAPPTLPTNSRRSTSKGAQSESRSAPSESRSPARQVDSDSGSEESETESKTEPETKDGNTGTLPMDSSKALSQTAVNKTNEESDETTSDASSTDSESSAEKKQASSSSEDESDRDEEEEEDTSVEASAVDPTSGPATKAVDLALSGSKTNFSSDDDPGKQLMAESSQSQLFLTQTQPTTSPPLASPFLAQRPSFNAMRERSMQNNAKSKMPSFKPPGPTLTRPKPQIQKAPSDSEPESESDEEPASFIQRLKSFAGSSQRR